MIAIIEGFILFNQENQVPIERFILFNQENQVSCDGNLVTMYSDLENYDVRVYYQSCVKPTGVSESHLIKICNLNGENCRKPYQQEIEKDRFIPQSQEK